MLRDLSDSERLESIRATGNAIFLVLCTMPLWMGWQVRELRALRDLPDRHCEAGDVDRDNRPVLPVSNPVPRNGVGDAAGQGYIDPAGHDLDGRPETVSQAAKHPHAGIVANTNRDG